MRPPKYRIFKTDNEDYIIKRRGCCLGWTEKSFDRSYDSIDTKDFGPFQTEMTYFNDLGSAVDTLKILVHREKRRKKCSEEKKVANKKRKKERKVYFNEN